MTVGPFRWSSRAWLVAAMAAILALLSTASADAFSAAPSAGSRVVAPNIAARITTVDGAQYAGAENSIYAADPRTIYIAYKRFLRDPNNSGGDVVPAELRVAKSADGGRTWDVKVIDPYAAERGDVVQQSVSISGDHGQVVYVSYLVQPLTGGMRLKIAKSTDGGQTWATRLVADGTGEYKDMKVIDGKTVLIASGSSRSSDLLVLMTTDGGVHWSQKLVNQGPNRFIGLDRRSDGHIFMSAYNGAPGDMSSMTTSSPMGWWNKRVVAGQPNDGADTGMWSTVDVVQAVILIGFQDFRPSTGRSVISILRSTDCGTTWSRFTADQGTGPGGRISLHAWRTRSIGQTDLFLGYRFYDAATRRGEARLAHSIDYGATWDATTLPELGSVQPYIDTAAASRDIQFVSYQVVDAVTQNQVLRFAQVDLTP